MSYITFCECQNSMLEETIPFKFEILLIFVTSINQFFSTKTSYLFRLSSQWMISKIYIGSVFSRHDNKPDWQIGFRHSITWRFIQYAPFGHLNQSTRNDSRKGLMALFFGTNPSEIEDELMARIHRGCVVNTEMNHVTAQDTHFITFYAVRHCLLFTRTDRHK